MQTDRDMVITVLHYLTRGRQGLYRVKNNTIIGFDTDVMNIQQILEFLDI